MVVEAISGRRCAGQGRARIEAETEVEVEVEVEVKKEIRIKVCNGAAVAVDRYNGRRSAHERCCCAGGGGGGDLGIDSDRF